MRYSYRKPYKIKKRRPILRSRFFWPVILFLVFIAGIFYFFFLSGIFQIKEIVISGEQKIPQEDIKSLIPAKNIFLINTEELQKDILYKFPRIAEVEIRRKFPNTMNIFMAERRAVAVWCQDRCFFINKEGIVFEEVLMPAEAEELIKISGEKDLLNKEKIIKILEIHGKLKDSFGVTTTQAVIASEARLNMKTSEGWEIYFNIAGDLDWQLQELGLVLEKQITPAKRSGLEYIDLRFSKVYYK